MTKFKLRKEELPFNRIRWHYRDFIIEDTRYSGEPYASWSIFNIKIGKNPDTNEPMIFRGNEIHHNGNGSRSEMIEWVDDYYVEMNEYVNDMGENYA
jgi:hypothetical protein